jgi:outer membrane protein assembly factor BamB
MFRSAAPGPLVVTAFNGRVIALEMQTGRVAWQVQQTGPLRLEVTETRVIAGGGERLGLYDYVTGSVIAQLDLIVGTLMVVGDRVLVSSSGSLTCVALHTGTIVWRNELPGTGYGAAALAVPGHSVQADY